MKILSQNEFRNFDEIIYQGIRQTIIIKFDDNSQIQCTLDHRLLITISNNQVWEEAQNIEIGDILNNKMAVDIQYQGEIPVYDVINVEFTNSYTIDGVENHNCNFLYVDEAAIIPNNVAEDFFTSTYPTISSGKTTKVVITSTPLGYNHFWKIWNEAENGKNGFTPVRVNYWEHPNRNEKWAKQQLELLGELRFNQEILCSFLGSSSTLLNSDTLSRLSANPFIYSKDGLDVLIQPEQNHSYIIVVDTAKGVGGDYSAFSIIDITELPYKLVAKYKNNTISPMLYPNVIYRLANEYNGSFVLIEINSSEQVGYILNVELEYENILYVSRNKTGQHISNSGNSKLGVNTDKKVKRIGCSNLKTLIEENKLLIQDIDIIAELSTFIEVKGSYVADDGYHDDLVMTLVLFAWLTSDPYFASLTDIDMRKSIYEERMRLIDQEMLPTGWFNDGSDDGVDSYANF